MQVSLIAYITAEEDEDPIKVDKLDRYLCHVAHDLDHCVWKGRSWDSSPYGKIIKALNQDHRPNWLNFDINQWHPIQVAGQPKKVGALIQKFEDV
jgi:hypothetical protein